MLSYMTAFNRIVARVCLWFSAFGLALMTVIICTPIFLPVMTQLGMDPVQFGIVLMVNLGIGLVTPPVGSVLFVGCAVGNVRMEDTTKTIWPFYLVMVITLLLVTYIPAISMFVPNLLQN